MLSAKTLLPVRGRKVFADILPGTWDWKGFFEPFGLNASGIAVSVWHPDVCFSKRFLQLRDLPQLNLPGWELENPHCVPGSDHASSGCCHGVQAVLVRRSAGAAPYAVDPAFSLCCAGSVPDRPAGPQHSLGSPHQGLQEDSCGGGHKPMVSPPCWGLPLGMGGGQRGEEVCQAAGDPLPPRGVPCCVG